MIVRSEMIFKGPWYALIGWQNKSDDKKGTRPLPFTGMTATEHAPPVCWGLMGLLVSCH